MLLDINIPGGIIKLIAWAPTILVFVIMLISFGIGCLRGFRKSLILLIGTVIALIVSYLIFLLVLSNQGIQKSLINSINGILPESIQSMLGIDESNKTVGEMAVAYVTKEVDTLKPATIEVITPYIKAISQALVGFVLMFVTLIIYFFVKFIVWIFYMIFFREGRHKKNMNAAHEADSTAPAYRKRKLLGGAIGAARGIITSVLVLCIFGASFYMVSGGEYKKMSASDKVVITSDGETNDITDVYRIINNYGTTGIMPVFESVKNLRGVPAYAGVATAFSKGQLKTDEVNTDIYTMEEVGALMRSVNELVYLLSDYNINVGSDTMIDQLSTLIKEDENFYKDLKSVFDGVNKSRLKKALSKTISNNLVKVVKAQYPDKDMEYFDIVFTGENAITISDLLSKDDIEVVLNILKMGLPIYEEYDDSGDEADVKSIVMNNTTNVSNIVDELLKLSVFKQTTKIDKLNNIISQLLEKGLAKVEQFEGLDLSGITWVQYDSSTDKVSGEISSFATSICDVLDSDFIDYKDGEFYFVFSEVSDLWTAFGDEPSAFDKIGESTALRRTISHLLSTNEVGDVTITIPAAACDSGTNYMSSVEFKKLFTTLKTILSEMELSEVVSTSDTLKDDLVPKVLKACEKEIVVDTLCDSVVLSGLVSSYVYDTLVDKGYATSFTSDLVLDDENINTNLTNWTSKTGELEKILIAVSKLYKTGLINYSDNKVTYDLNKIKDIAIVVEGETKAPISYLSDSKVLRCIISSYLAKNTEVSNINIYVPASSYEDAETKLISSSEYGNIINGIKSLCSNLNLEGITLTKDNIKDEIVSPMIDTFSNDNVINDITSSQIVSGTLSKFLYDTLKDSTVTASAIPTSLSLDEEHIDTNMNEWIKENGELSSIIKAISAAKSKDVISVDMSLSNPITYEIKKVTNLFDDSENEPIDKVLNSKIMHRLLSNELVGLDMGYSLYLPADTYTMDGETKVINKADLKLALDSAMVIVNDESIDLDAASEVIKDSVLERLKIVAKDDALTDKLFASSIIEGTMVDVLWQEVNGNTNIVIPTGYDLTGTNYDTNFSNWIGTDGEIRKIFKALGIIDIDDVEGAEFILDVSESNVTKLLSSNILANTITSKITETSMDGITIYTVTEAYDTSRNYSFTTTEIWNILEAIRALTGYNELTAEQKAAFAFDTVDIDIATKLNNDEVLNKLYASVTLETTVSKYIYDKAKDNTTIPANLALSETPADKIFTGTTNIYNWIRTSDENKELQKIINAIRTLDLLADIETGINVGVECALDLTEADVTTIMTSDIIASTITKEALDTSMDSIVIYTVADSYNPSRDNIFKDSEVYNLLVAIRALTGYDGLTEEQKNSFSLDTVDIDIATKLNSDEVLNKLYASSILETTVSKYIYEQAKTNTTIPTNLALSETPTDKIFTNTTNIYNWIKLSGTNKELQKIINAIRTLDLLADIETEINVGVECALDLTQSDVTTVMASDIIGTTITKETMDTSMDGIDIYAITDAYNSSRENIFKDSEVYRLLVAIRALTDYDTLTNEQKAAFSLDDVVIDVSGKLSSEATIDTLFASIVIQATMSKYISDSMDPATISIPADLLLPVPTDKIFTNDTNIYNWVNDGTTKKELRHIIDSLNTLDLMEQLDAAEGDVTFAVDDIFNYSITQIDTVLLSIIMWNEISIDIKKPENGLVVPYEALSSERSGYIIKNHITDIVMAINAAVGSGTATLSAATNINPMNITSSEDVANSLIVRTTITNTISSLGKIATSIEMTESELTYHSSTIASQGILVLTKAELEAIIEGVQIFGLTSFTSISGINYSSVLSLTEDQRTTVLSSGVFWYKISDLTIAYAGSNTTLTSVYQPNSNVLSNIQIVNKDYII